MNWIQTTTYGNIEVVYTVTNCHRSFDKMSTENLSYVN